jgi:hypothetical protein
MDFVPVRPSEHSLAQFFSLEQIAHLPLVLGQHEILKCYFDFFDNKKDPNAFYIL